MIGAVLQSRTKGASAVEVVGQQGGAWVVVDVGGGSPRELSPAALSALFRVEPVAPEQPDLQDGYAVLAAAHHRDRIAAATATAPPSPEEVFAGAADAD